MLPSAAEFQSTLPVGGATVWDAGHHQYLRISIHAPRGGSDIDSKTSTNQPKDFNPRSPWAERRLTNWLWLIRLHFNPRSPWGERQTSLPISFPPYDFNPRSPWGERPVDRRLNPVTASIISIHAPRGGSDRIKKRLLQFVVNFNPRSPWGERLVPNRIIWKHWKISIHAPRGGSDFSTPWRWYA